MPPLIVRLCALCLIVATPLVAAAERPNAMRLFPGRAVFFFRAPDATELNDRFLTGGGDKMLGDPEVGGFLKTLFAKIDESFRSGPGEATGGGLADLLALFEGEVAFAVVPRRNEAPGIVFLADTVSGANRTAGDRQALIDGTDRAAKLIESAKRKAEADGFLVSTELVASTEAVVTRRGNDQRSTVGLVEREGVLVVSNDKLLLESVILKWDNAEGLVSESEIEEAVDGSASDDESKRIARLRRRYTEPLSENESFTEALRECVSERLGGGDESPPQLVAFIDPIGIFRAIAQENAGMRLALATLPILGLDGVEGAAGAAWVNEGEWDVLLRGHLLLDNPRAGVLKMVRLQPCDPAPGDAIPGDVASYTCGAIDLQSTLSGAEQLYDRIRGDGEFAKLVEENVTKRVGVAPKDIASHLTGRFVTIQGYGDTEDGAPVRVTPARATILDVNDSDWALATLREALKRMAPQTQWREHGGVEYAQIDGFEPATFAEGRPPRPVFLSCVAVIDDQVVLTETQALLHKLIDTRADVGDRLADNLPFRLMMGRTTRLGSQTVGGEEGRLVMYENPAAQFRRWNTAGTDGASLEQLDQIANVAPPMRWLRDAIQEAGVPSAEAMLKFANPSGSAIYDTPRGFRYVAFSFKLDEE